MIYRSDELRGPDLFAVVDREGTIRNWPPAATSREHALVIARQCNENKEALGAGWRGPFRVLRYEPVEVVPEGSPVPRPGPREGA